MPGNDLALYGRNVRAPSVVRLRAKTSTRNTEKTALSREMFSFCVKPSFSGGGGASACLRMSDTRRFEYLTLPSRAASGRQKGPAAPPIRLNIESGTREISSVAPQGLGQRGMHHGPVVREAHRYSDD